MKQSPKDPEEFARQLREATVIEGSEEEFAESQAKLRTLLASKIAEPCSLCGINGGAGCGGRCRVR
jgi:hypothetical protein